MSDTGLDFFHQWQIKAPKLMSLSAKDTPNPFCRAGSCPFQISSLPKPFCRAGGDMCEAITGPGERGRDHLQEVKERGCDSETTPQARLKR